MKKVAGAEAKPSMLGLFYGPAKTRKTTTALCIPPEMRPVAYLDTDRGARMRLKLLTMTPKQRESLDVWEEIPEFIGPWVAKDIDFFYPETGQYYGDCWEFVTKTSKDYKSVIIDTLSRMSDGIMHEVIRTDYENVKNTDPRMTLRTKGGGVTKHAAIQDYGFSQDRIMEIIMAANESNAHVLMISHEKTGEIKEGATTKRVIAGPRSMGNALLEVIPAVVDLALRFEPRMLGVGKGTQVIMRSRNHNIYQAGDRSGLFPDGEVLDIQSLWNRILGLIDLAGPEKTAVVKAAKEGQ